MCFGDHTSGAVLTQMGVSLQFPKLSYLHLQCLFHKDCSSIINVQTTFSVLSTELAT